MLDKLGGNFAPRPSTGPHKLRECLPLSIFIRNRLKFALNYNECTKILAQKLIKVDGKVRTDKKYPAGFMDVISIEKTNEHFRLVYDTKGRFAIHRIHPEEAKYKLCKVRKVLIASGGVPYLVTHDGRTIRYPDPNIKPNDTIQVDIATGKVLNHIKFEPGKCQEIFIHWVQVIFAWSLVAVTWVVLGLLHNGNVTLDLWKWFTFGIALDISSSPG